jgi:DNA-binding SARP family transcriptional activator
MSVPLNGSRGTAAPPDRASGAAAIPAPIEAQWPLLICLLGRFRLAKRGVAIPVRPGGKTEALLCLLAMACGRGVARSSLLATLWPHSDTLQASQSLNSLVYSLHKSLGDALGGVPPVIHVDGAYQLNLEAGIGVDTAQFDALVAAGESFERAGDAGRAAQTYESALRLYHGDFWSGADAFTDVQALIERERLRALYLALLARLAEFAYRRDDLAVCLDYALRLLAQDPCREDAHRQVMRCHVRRGERAQALRQYRLCERVLRLEFDAEPEPATKGLFEQVRRDPTSVA